MTDPGKARPLPRRIAQIAVLALAWGIAVFAVGAVGGGCGQSGSSPADASITEAITVCGPTVPGSACATTCGQTQAIFEKYCVVCHEHDQITQLDQILDVNALVNVPANAQLAPGWKYVVPGDPARSLIYQRVAVTRDMPYVPDDMPTTNRPNTSDFSILYEWIANCVAGSQ